MKKLFGKIGVVLILLTMSFQAVPAMGLEEGCGECWQNGVKSVTWKPFATSYILCNCDTAYGSTNGDCVCKDNNL